MMMNQQKAFTLIELSIVLVIIGLIVGGVLVGRDLIRASEMLSIGADITRYNAAIMTFRGKYNALPGDMNNATAFWGIAAGNGSDNTCHGVEGTGTATCNGNGDGIVYLATGVPGPREYFIFWKHLANAGLIQGKYTGISGPDSLNHPIAGVNMPQLRYSNSALVLGYTGGYYGGDTVWFPGYYGNNIAIGAPINNGSSIGPLFRPGEMLNLDAKYDDGKPGSGRMLGIKSCSDSTDPDTAKYLVSSSLPTCWFFWTRLTE